MLRRRKTRNSEEKNRKKHSVGIEVSDKAGHNEEDGSSTARREGFVYLPKGGEERQP